MPRIPDDKIAHLRFLVDVTMGRVRAGMVPATDAAREEARLRMYEIATEVPALLSEREEMQQEIEALTGDLSLADGRAEEIENLSRWRAAALSVLREVEWQGWGDGDVEACPLCSGRAPHEHPHPTRGTAHLPGCRLAALLTGKP